jgi:hypothetical protein
MDRGNAAGLVCALRRGKVGLRLGEHLEFSTLAPIDNVMPSSWRHPLPTSTHAESA